MKQKSELRPKQIANCWIGDMAVLQVVRRFGLRLEEDPALGERTNQVITRLAIRISNVET